MIEAIKQYFKNVLIGLDQFIWTLLGGDPDETISAAMWRLSLDGSKIATFMRKLIDWIALKFFDQEDHCQVAYISEVLNKHLPEEYQ